MSDSYGSMIGRALLGDDAEKQKQMVRVDCKMFASNRMFCECGVCFDQKKIQILRDATGKTKAVCCQDCRLKAEKQFAGQSLPGWLWLNWQDTTGSPAIPDATEIANREAKEAKDKLPKPLKAMTRTEVLGEVSAKRRGDYKDTLQRCGLLMCGVMVIDTTGEGGKGCNDNMVERGLRFLNSSVDGFVYVGKLLPVEQGLEHLTYRQMTDNDGSDVNVVCTVNEVYRLTCEKLGKVVRWQYSQGAPVPCVVGYDDCGVRRACLAVVETRKTT